MKATITSFQILFTLLFLNALNVYSQWQVTGLEYPNSAVSIAINGNSIFAASNFNGVFKSVDDCNTWATVNNGLPQGIIVKELFFSGNTLLLGSADQGVYRSTDFGSNWVASNTGISGNYQIKAFVQKGNLIFVATQGGGVYKSSDVGVTWTLSGISNGLAQDLLVYNNYIFCATAGNGIYRSSNNGASWSTMNAGLTGNTVYTLGLNGSTLFAGTNTGVFYSSNLGNSWTQCPSGPNGTSTVYAMAFASAGSDFYAGFNGDGVFKTSNNGQTWSNIDSLSVSYTFAFAQYNQYLLVGTGSFGLYKYALTTGINENSHSNFANLMDVVSANPSGSKIEINLHISRPGKFSLNIYNMLGEHIFNLFDGKLNQGDHSFSQNTSGIPNGIFLISFETPDGTLTKKWVVNR